MKKYIIKILIELEDEYSKSKSWFGPEDLTFVAFMKFVKEKYK